jgi:monoamine oxidase
MRADPHPVLRRLREEDPVHLEAGIVFLSRHRDCRDVLRDPTFASGQAMRAASGDLPATMLSADGAEHARLRDPARGPLAPPAAETLRPVVRGAVADALDALRGRTHADLVAEVAEPVALRGLTALLGVPRADEPRLGDALERATPTLDPFVAGAAATAAHDAAGEVRDRLAATALARDLAPRLGRREAGELCALLAVGGFAPAVHLAGNGLRALLEHPAERARLRAHPELTRPALEELLRFDSPIPFAARVPGRATELGGRPIPAGQPVVCLLLAANRDPAAFADPDRLDLARRPNPHLGFGGGAHFCLGAPLARVIAEEIVAGVLRALPAAAAADEPWRWRVGLVPHGLATLPVRLRTRQRARRRPDVVILGAGMAGLACGAELARRGVAAVVLEARDRVGGRVATVHGANEPLELGAQVVHGGTGTLWPLLRSLGVRTGARPPVEQMRVVLGEHRLSAHDLVRAGVAPPWALAERLAAAQLGDLPVGPLLARFAGGTAEAQLARDWIAQAWCADPDELSAAGLAVLVAAQRRRGGGEYVVLDGYDAVPRRLATGLDVRLGEPVSAVDWAHGGVEVRTPGGTIAARAAVVTIPPSAVAAGGPVFAPELPEAKRRAARELRIGDAVVVVLRAPAPAPASAWALVSGAGASLWEARAGSRRLVGWFKGPSARAARDSAQDAARRAFEWVGSGELEPAAQLDWGADPFARGAYSYPRAGRLGAAADWARGIEGVLHFAGEATATGSDAPLTDTAMDSGIRAARRVAATLA